MGFFPLVYTEYLKIMDSDLGTYITETKKLVEAQNFQKAFEVFTEALKLYPSSSELKDGLRKMQEGVLEKISPKSVISPMSTNLRPLPGDDTLLQKEEELVKQWTEEADDNDVTKSSVEFPVDVSKVTEKAVELFKNGETRKGRQLLDFCFRYSDHDVGDLMLSVYDEGLYKECVYNCLAIPNERRAPSVWITGAKAANRLALPALAEHWLRTVFESDDSDTNVTRQAIQLFLNVRTSRLFTTLSTDTNIEVKLTERGRHVQSSCSTTVQSVVFRESPVLLAPALDCEYGTIPSCSHCAKCLVSAEEFFGLKILKSNKILKNAVDQFWITRTPVKCEYCSIELYCSDECRRESWEGYHKVICSSQNEHSSKLYKICSEYKKALVEDTETPQGWWYENFSPFLLARLWATILCDATNNPENTNISQTADFGITRARRKFESFQVNGHGGMTKKIPKMYDLMVKMFSNKDQSRHYKITPEEFNFRYGQIIRNVQAFSDPNHPYFEFRKHVDRTPEMKSLQKILSNTVKEVVFAGLFSVQSSLNHSCASNVEIISGNVNEAPGIHVISRKPIKEGEELLVSYVDPSLTRQQRRGLLYRLYHFWCECPGCLFEGDDADTCTECRKESEDEKGFPSCGRCRKAWYCSKVCQKTAWRRGHKEICVSG